MLRPRYIYMCGYWTSLRSDDSYLCPAYITPFTDSVKCLEFYETMPVRNTYNNGCIPCLLSTHESLHDRCMMIFEWSVDNVYHLQSMHVNKSMHHLPTQEYTHEISYVEQPEPMLYCDNNKYMVVY